MTVYLDASVLVSLFVRDVNTPRADGLLREAVPVLIVSDFGVAEFSSGVARRVRTGDLSVTDAHTAFATFEGWMARTVQRIEMVPADVTTATAFIRRLDLNLRAPDALNLAIAQRVGARLMTFDVGMEASARKLGVPLLDTETTTKRPD